MYLTEPEFESLDLLFAQSSPFQTFVFQLLPFLKYISTSIDTLVQEFLDETVTELN